VLTIAVGLIRIFGHFSLKGAVTNSLFVGDVAGISFHKSPALISFSADSISSLKLFLILAKPFA
jgi:hypothetical protein